MAESRPGRSRAVVALIVVATMLATALVGIVPAGSQTAGTTVAVDVSAFSKRAVAWSAANVIHRTAAVERAEALGEEAAEAEAAAEAARQAALAAAAATTSAPPTTAAPTTTAPPTTTAAPTTTVASTTTAAPADDTTTTTAAPTTTTTAAPPAGGPTEEQWAALRNCESGGRYDALSPSGRYRGAYQFSQATWDWVASFSNTALVGVDPAAASVADQDAQARALYDRNGAGPWPHCGRYLV